MYQKGLLTLPIAIIVAGVLVAGSIFLVFKDRGGGADGQTAAVNQPKNAPPPATDEHILGNPNAPVVIVEYTDLECPYCKSFHFTMKALMEDYGKRGELAWVVRHFPVPQIHPLAVDEHEAAECAAEIGGNAAFFAYIDGIFTRTPSNNGLDSELLPVVAGEIGIDKDLFTECLESNRYHELVKNQAEEAFRAGAEGTPHNILFFDNERHAIPGAQSIRTMRGLIDTLLLNPPGGEGN